MGLLSFLFPSAEDIGEKGERLTAKKLVRVDKTGFSGKVLQNIYIPKSNGETSEIDLLFITKIGIFVIESKNYSGYIFGTDTNQKWTLTLHAGQGFTEKHQFYNPIKQNQTHIKWLNRYLNEDIRMFSIIAFSQRCELMSIDLSSSPQEVFVCHRNRIPKIIKECFNKYDECLSENRIEEIYKKLSVLTNVDEAIKAQHIKDATNKINGVVCPFCGGQLILRTAKKGTNTGRQFYGCSNYPKCKYTRNIK